MTSGKWISIVTIVDFIMLELVVDVLGSLQTCDALSSMLLICES